jgi:mandelate racemase
MNIETLTLRGLRARPVLLPLRRPIVARIATMGQWPMILIDLSTEEGVIGRAYIEPYVPKAMKYLVAALNDLGDMLTGQRVAPVEFIALHGGPCTSWVMRG